MRETVRLKDKTKMRATVRLKGKTKDESDSETKR